MKKKINSNPIRLLPGLLLLSLAVICFCGCSEQPGKTSDIPGYILPSDLRDSLPAEVIAKVAALHNDMKAGKDPSFENVSPIFPKMKYPQAIVGVKEHVGRFYVSWDGRIICPPLHVFFRLGRDTTTFGEEAENLSRSLVDGYLPVITTTYTHEGLVYEETVYGYSPDFSTSKPLAAFIRMKVINPSSDARESRLTVCFQNVAEEGKYKLPKKDVPVSEKLSLIGKNIQNEKGNVIFCSKQAGGIFDKDRLLFDFKLNSGTEKEFVFCFPHLPIQKIDESNLTNGSFDEGLDKVRAFWKEVVERGMELNVPEPIVTNAYKTWLINNFLLAEEDIGSGYYEVHDAPYFYTSVYGFASAMYLNTLTTRGYFDEAKKCVDMFIGFQQENGFFTGKKPDIIPHQNGSIIYAICQLYRTTGDKEWFQKIVPHVIKACDAIILDRRSNMQPGDGVNPATYGLLSEYRYCVDGVGKATYAREYLGNAWCWAGMNEAAIALGELEGEYKKESERLKKEAEDYRRDIFSSIEKTVIKEKGVTFLPLVITDTAIYKTMGESEMSMYYNILSPRMIESGIFDRKDKRINWIPDYLEQSGRLVLGMPRWRGSGGFDPHFIAGYALTNLRLDRIDKFLLSFYGIVAYGMARETFATNEHWFITTGTSNYLNVGEKHWASARQPHLHSTVESIRMTNMMLIREEGDEIWLIWGTPRKWLEDGKKIEIKKANTVFGSFDFTVESHVSDDYIKTDIHAQLRKSPSVIRLKVRHPEGKKIRKVEINGESWKNFNNEVIDVVPHEGNVSVVAHY
jgi:hypothetical protein